MHLSLILPILSTSAGIASAQNTSPFVIYNQTQRLPHGCVDGYVAGTSTVHHTLPYPFNRVLSLIDTFSNLTYQGNPPDTITLNGTDNQVGTARFYNTAGARVIETLTTYAAPFAGPYEEIHTLAPLTIPAANVSLYAPFDGTFATAACNGFASVLNFTIDFCSTNVTAATAVLDMIHSNDAKTLQAYLGNETFTSCTALNSTSAGTNATTDAPAAFTGSASVCSWSKVLLALPALLMSVM